MENQSNSHTTFTLKALAAPFLRGWQLLAAGIVLGGLAGLWIASIIKPVYEATAILTFGIDYARTGLLTDIEEDLAMEVAGDLLYSSGVLSEVIQQASETGIKLDEENIRKDLKAERRFGQWLLKVRADDPTKASNLANLWSKAAFTGLEKASLAALKADGLQRYILSLETCLQQSTSGLSAQPLCLAKDRAALLSEIDRSGEDLQRWQAESGGLFPGLNFAVAQEASVPVKPLQHSRGELVLAGGVAGLLAVSLFLLFSRKI
jgi:hypothetical protein